MLSDYFGKAILPEIVDETKSAIGTAQTSDDQTPLQSFAWGIGAVVSALLRHDFQIVALLELPDPDLFRGLGDAADCVPAVYRLMAKWN